MALSIVFCKRQTLSINMMAMQVFPLHVGKNQPYGHEPFVIWSGFGLLYANAGFATLGGSSN